MNIVRLHTRRSSGFVLIVVVIGLALMMVLLLALFQGTLQQRHGAAGGEMVERDKLLADTAVALVIGQIKQASSQTGQAWISQPGLLRTYAADASRKPTTCYKLYSTADPAAMIDKSGALGFMANDVPTDWSSRPAEFTNLNAPAQTPGLFSSSIYPILDPAAAAVPGIKIDSGHSVEMPVAWIYQLQDGTLGPAGNATAANPIVARFAFWTDDETSKININTAGSGSPWNAPHMNSPEDVAWGKMQPAAGEYSAYPGHPATTSLGFAFNSAFTPQQLLGFTPRYAWGGSQFGTVATTPGQVLAPKTDRFYNSIDELCFGAAANNGQRTASAITPAQINASRFVLTAHSVAPETTLLGAPRVAIWPIADSTSDIAPRITPTDKAIAAASTVGTGTSNVRRYYFQRNNPLDPLDDFNPAAPLSAATDSNLKLFNELVARGQAIPPGYAAALSSTAAFAKYPDANWKQIMLEITDYIHCLNAVDPTPAPFVSFAGGDAANVGRGFVVPLTMTYGANAAQNPLRGLGRCPTLQSLTLVFYVCGYETKTGTVVKDFDYTATPDTNDGTDWQAHFSLTGTNQWANVKAELIRGFVVPCTFQPGCAFPEVSDACEIQIDGLDKIQLTNVSTGSKSDLQFPPVNKAISRLLSDAQSVLPADRSWGGNEGPQAWRAAAKDPTAPYPFASTKAFVFPIRSGSAYTTAAWLNSIAFNGVDLVVTIRDPSNPNAAPWQTVNVKFPALTISGPTANGECDYSADPALARTFVYPSYYMSLANRIRATQTSSRGAMIQAGDISRGVEAATDLRVIAGLNTVDSSMFAGLKLYSGGTRSTQGGNHAHNLRFADGTSACFAPISDASDFDRVKLTTDGTYPKQIVPMVNTVDWNPSVKTLIPYNQFTNASASAPTGTTFVSMGTGGPLGDWDTGPGVASDGAMINLPDSGTALDPATAYQSLSGSQLAAATQRTPNALVPSPVIFGSLPAGINPVVNQTTQSVPWRTLLFCPIPAAGDTHPGAVSPPDHLILDNFWMPVVESTPISSTMATAGKINLNDQVAPFTWLHRNTALRAVLDSIRIPAIPVSASATFKLAAGTTSIWNAVDADATLAQIDNRFAGTSTDAYLSESEICTVPLVPLIKPTSPFSTDVAATKTALASFWNAKPTINGNFTGDNLRELPYAQIYSRLTTRSNSYTVHIRAQVLKKVTFDPDQNVWKEGSDVVLSDWRGSYEIERYLDPDAPAPTTVDPRLTAWKFRVVSTGTFAP